MHIIQRSQIVFDSNIVLENKILNIYGCRKYQMLDNGVIVDNAAGRLAQGNVLPFRIAGNHHGFARLYLNPSYAQQRVKFEGSPASRSAFRP